MDLPRAYEQNKIALNSTYILFYAGISAHKIYYSLWMEQDGKIHYSTAAYCSQAFAILITSLLLSRIQPKYNLILLCGTMFLAGFGIYLSSFSSNILYPIAGGFINGFGVCIVFLTINSLMKALTANNNFLYSGIINNLGRLMGIALVMAYLYMYQPASLQSSLYLGTALILMSIIPMLFADKAKINTTNIDLTKNTIIWKEFLKMYSNDREILSLGLLMNFFFAVSINVLFLYFPVILYRNGSELFTIGYTMILGMLAVIVGQNFFMHYPVNRDFSKRFIRGNIILMALILLMYSQKVFSYPVGIMLFFLPAALTNATKRFIENRVVSTISKSWLSVILIITMLGNIAGVLIGGFLIYHQMIDQMFIVSAIFTIISWVVCSKYTEKIRAVRMKNISNYTEMPIEEK